MNKKITFAIITILFCTWIILGMAARMNILSLIAMSDFESPQNSANNFDDIAFGVSFNLYNNEASSDIVWLPKRENAILRNLLVNANLGSCMSCEDYFMAEGCVMGGFYLLPLWVQKTGLTSILQPFIHRIEMFYWPSKELLYLSEDIEALGYDFSRGLNVTNVCPKILMGNGVCPHSFLAISLLMIFYKRICPKG